MLCLIVNVTTIKIRVCALAKEGIPIEKDVRQDDAISPKLFTFALESVQRNGLVPERHKHKKNMLFADDIVLISTDADEIIDMLMDSKEASQEVGLKMNLLETQILTSNNIQVAIDYQTL